MKILRNLRNFGNFPELNLNMRLNLNYNNTFWINSKELITLFFSLVIFRFINIFGNFFGLFIIIKSFF